MRLKRFPVDTLQIYFAASLELQRELINHGFYVPMSADRKISMPIPIIYSNFRGCIEASEPITIERLIPPEWFGSTAQRLRWLKTSRDGKEAYLLPQEEVYVDMRIECNHVTFDLDIKGYHLERASIRGVNPEKWTNWAMFYIDAKYIPELIEELRNSLPQRRTPQATHRPRKEKQQGGKEVTYYVEVPVVDFSLCLGCFGLARDYLYTKAKEHCAVNPSLALCTNLHSTINKLKLRLKYSPEVKTFAKVGVAKVAGKRPQMMVKLASKEPKIAIAGVLKDRIEGKARGALIHCNHEGMRQYITLDLIGFYGALIATREYVERLPKDT